MSTPRLPISLTLLVLLLLAGCSGGGAPGVSGGSGGAGNTIMLGHAQAIWLDANTIVWPGVDAAHSYKLYYSSSAPSPRARATSAAAMIPPGSRSPPGR
jgi:hypothetical protein